MDRIMDDINKLNDTLYERNEEIKKLMQDKIELLEKLVSLYEFIHNKPMFLSKEDFAMQTGEKFNQRYMATGEEIRARTGHFRNLTK